MQLDILVLVSPAWKQEEAAVLAHVQPCARLTKVGKLLGCSPLQWHQLGKEGALQGKEEIAVSSRIQTHGFRGDYNPNTALLTTQPS